MAYIAQQVSTTSAVGVNSYTLTTPSGSLWVGNTFTGAGEQNDFAYMGVNLQTDDTGTLTFQFSQDGTNWSNYPVTEFTIASGINEVHTAWKGGRYVRPIFTGANGGRTYFRLQTYYSNHPLPLTAPLNQSISSDQDAQVVRAVLTGQQPDGDFVNAKSDGTFFTETGSLSANASFTSSWYDTDGYDSVVLFIQADVSSSFDGITIEYTDDVQRTPSPVIRHTVNYNYGQSAVDRGNIIIPFKSKLDGFRIKYLNGPGAQSSFFAAADGRVSQEIHLPLDQPIVGGTDAIVNRTVLVGENQAGRYRNVGIDSENHIKVRLAEPVSAFGEIRTAELSPTIQLAFPYNINPDVVTSATNGTATTAVSQSVLLVSTGATAGSSGSIQSVRAHKYRAGQGALVRFTAGFTTGSTVGCTSLAGIGDVNDGFFIEMSGSSFGVSRVRGGMNTFVSQSKFNIDKLDGTSTIDNPSGMLVRPNYVNVFQIQYQYLGFGTIEYSIEEPTSGRFVPFHRIQYANQNQIPTVFNPTLPIRFFATNGSNAETVTVRTASAGSFTEGSIRPSGPVNAFKHSKTSGTNTMMLTLRNNDIVNGTVNRDVVKLKLGSFVADGTAAVTYDVYKNATLTSTNYINIDATRSMVSYDTGSTWTPGTGNLVLFEGLSKADSDNVSLDILNLELLPSETLTVIGNGSNVGATVGFTWLEDI